MLKALKIEKRESLLDFLSKYFWDSFTSKPSWGTIFSTYIFRGLYCMRMNIESNKSLY